MKKKENKIGKLLYIILVIMILIGISKVYTIYQQNNFYEFIKTEYIPYTSKFTRDNEIRYGAESSYKITSEKMNDAMFYQEVAIQKNTPYRVTCMVKTENVITQKEISNAGAQISIADTVEKSQSITGTKDWQKLEFIFNSKDRTSVQIGFRLGGYDDNCTGSVWFSDFTIEAGSKYTDTKWKFACFIIENTQVKIENNGTVKEVDLQMNQTDISDMKQNMRRFKSSCEELSQNKMTADYDIFTIKEPLTSLSYDEENGYYVAPENVVNLIQSYIEQKEYDHIFIAVRLGDTQHRTDIPVNDWIGLGGMEYQGMGFSNIRLPNDEKSYIYKYDTRMNTFPEEVFVHEFLHSLEKNAKEYGYQVPALHDYKVYGYQEEKLIGQKKWYQDYMNTQIPTKNGQTIGLPNEIYSLKPSHSSNFEFSYVLNYFKEPSNIIEEIQAFFKILEKNVQRLNNKEEGNIVNGSI